MYSGARAAMSTVIKKAADWLACRPKAREWAWFVLLWLGGLFAVLAFAYPIKWVIRSMS